LSGLTKFLVSAITGECDKVTALRSERVKANRESSEL
jgi:hypothetical protein